MEKTTPDFKAFFQALTDEQKAEFAAEAITTVSYIKTHLIYSRKVPKKKLLDGLVRACEKQNSGITRADLLAFFYPAAEDKAA
jgi:hypothetical protein